MSAALRILVVDDDPAMVGAITALVGTEGHQVITAYDGLTAVRRMREDAPDIVLLDLAMPGPDGFAVAGQIRARRHDADPRRERREQRGGQGARPAAWAPTTTWPSRSARASCWRASPRSCGAPSRASAGPAAGPLRMGRPWRSTRPATARSVGPVALALTPTEFRLLEALVRAPETSVPHQRLARAGWPMERDPDLLWLKPHLARLRAKLAQAGGPGIEALRGVGYRLIGQAAT